MTYREPEPKDIGKKIEVRNVYLHNGKFSNSHEWSRRTYVGTLAPVSLYNAQNLKLPRVHACFNSGKFDLVLWEEARVKDD